MNIYRWKWRLCLSFLALLTGSMGSVSAAEDAKGIASYEDFIKSVERAKFSEFKELRESAVSEEKEFSRMQKHILGLYEGVVVTNSFFDLSESIVDCVTIESQPGLRGQKLAKAPKQAIRPKSKEGGEKKPKAELVKPQLGKNQRDKFQNLQYCEEGTIPMRRLSLEVISRFKTLDDFLAKEPRPRDDSKVRKEPVPGDGDTFTHYWAHAKQNVENFGGDSVLNVWKPEADPGWFSLSQHWYVGGTGANKQTVEGGWQVARRKYSNRDPNLFIYYTSANYASGSGCYNLDCAGFVQINNSWVLGGKLSPVSTTGSTQYIIRMQWQLYEGNWWLFLKGAGDYTAVGYYPGSVYKGGQLTRYATKVDYGGEVSSLLGDTETGQMGSGKKASHGWQQSAYQRTIYYINSSHQGVWANLTAVQSTPDCYTVDLHNLTSSSWATYFYYGGPKCPNP